MPHVYIEKNPEGKFEVREQGKAQPVFVAPTQKQAEEHANKAYPGVKLDVERVRHTDRGHPDQWRKE